MWTLYLILLIERNRQVQQILPFVSYNTSAPRIIFGFKLNTAASHIPHVSPNTYKIEVIHQKNNSRCNLGMKVKHYFNVMLVDDVQMRNRACLVEHHIGPSQGSVPNEQLWSTVFFWTTNEIKGWMPSSK